MHSSFLAQTSPFRLANPLNASLSKDRISKTLLSLQENTDFAFSKQSQADSAETPPRMRPVVERRVLTKQFAPRSGNTHWNKYDSNISAMNSRNLDSTFLGPLTTRNGTASRIVGLSKPDCCWNVWSAFQTLRFNGLVQSTHPRIAHYSQQALMRLLYGLFVSCPTQQTDAAACATRVDYHRPRTQHRQEVDWRRAVQTRLLLFRGINR